MVDQNEKVDPEQLRKDREKLERRQKEEKARLQAEAIAAKKEAALEARRMRELEREAARRALQQVSLFALCFFALSTSFLIRFTFLFGATSGKLTESYAVQGYLH
jgi:uncharacterized membrane protein (DUF106 family)